MVEVDEPIEDGDNSGAESECAEMFLDGQLVEKDQAIVNERDGAEDHNCGSGDVVKEGGIEGRRDVVEDLSSEAAEVGITARRDVGDAAGCDVVVEAGGLGAEGRAEEETSHTMTFALPPPGKVIVFCQCPCGNKIFAFANVGDEVVLRCQHCMKLFRGVVSVFFH